MTEDIEFSLSILEKEYEKRKARLVEDYNLSASDKRSVITDLERILRASTKIKHQFL